jgi:Raf kinase inhibitor-like YbhB/YbcL family protein
MRFWPKKKWKQALLVAFVAIIIIVPVGFGVLSYVNREPAFKNGAAQTTLTVSSPAFDNGAAIPTKYTAMGENVNPPLNVAEIPEGTQSIVVLVRDPVAPMFSWIHWVAWNLPVSNITENTMAGVQGINSWNTNGYRGPDPMGTRTYIFTVYALDETLSLDTNSGVSAVFRAMDNHVLAKGEMTGTSTK